MRIHHPNFLVHLTTDSGNQSTSPLGILLACSLLWSSSACGVQPHQHFESLVAHPTTNLLYGNTGNGISRFNVLSDGKSIENVGITRLSNGHGKLLIDPEGKFLSLVRSPIGQVLLFRVEQSGGALTPRDAIDVGDSPGNATPITEVIGSAIHPSGRYIYLSGRHQRSNERYLIATLRIDKARENVSLARISESECFGNLAVHPSGRFLYQLSRFGRGLRLTAFNIDPINGQLRLIQSSSVSIGDEEKDSGVCIRGIHAPRNDIAFDKNGTSIFVLGGGTDSGHYKVIAGRIDPRRGTVAFTGWIETEYSITSILSDGHNHRLYVEVDPQTSGLGKTVLVHEIQTIKRQKIVPSDRAITALPETVYTTHGGGLAFINWTKEQAPNIANLYEYLRTKMAGSKFEFLRVGNCKPDRTCDLHGESGPNVKITLLGVKGSLCKARTGGEVRTEGPVIPYRLTRIKFDNSCPVDAYLLAVTSDRIKSYQPAVIQASKSDEISRRVVSGFGVHTPTPGISSRPLPIFFDRWKLPSGDGIQARVPIRFHLFSYAVEKEVAHIAIMERGDPDAINGPTLFMSDGPPYVVSHIYYWGFFSGEGKATTKISPSPIFGFMLNGERYLLVSGSWCSGCGHHGIELHRLERDRSIRVYGNADGST
jgi:hypothetical protein